MMSGQAPFDAAEVDAAFTQWAETAQKRPGLLPDNSKTGGDNRASPKIWVDKPDFDAKAAAFAKVVSDNRDKAKSSLQGLQLRASPAGRAATGRAVFPTSSNTSSRIGARPKSRKRSSPVLRPPPTGSAATGRGGSNTSQMTAADRMAIATYIKSLPAVEGRKPPPERKE